MSPAVYIAQLLCPSRHSIMAVSHVCGSDAEEEALAAALWHRFDEAVAANVLNRRCGLCGSTNLHVETARTRFATMEEAMPHLKACEEAQRQTAAALKASRN